MSTPENIPNEETRSDETKILISNALIKAAFTSPVAGTQAGDELLDEAFEVRNSVGTEE